MGTRVELHVFDTGARDGAFASALAAARRAVEAVDDALTIHRPSAATALNEALMTGQEVAITDPILFDALVAVDEGYAATHALFDVAADRHRAGSWSMVTLDPAARRIAAARPLALDFGGMGKGMALDRAVAALRASGVTCALLSAGESSIAVIGEHPLGGGWPFAIPHPTRADETLVEIELIDQALSVSASAGPGTAAPERAATLRPRDRSQVTVPCTTVAIDASATAAEIASTALLAADAEEASHLIAAAPEGRFRFDLTGSEDAVSGADRLPIEECYA